MVGVIIKRHRVDTLHDLRWQVERGIGHRAVVQPQGLVAVGIVLQRGVNAAADLRHGMGFGPIEITADIGFEVDVAQFVILIIQYFTAGSKISGQPVQFVVGKAIPALGGVIVAGRERERKEEEGAKGTR